MPRRWILLALLQAVLWSGTTTTAEPAVPPPAAPNAKPGPSGPDQAAPTPSPDHPAASPEGDSTRIGQRPSDGGGGDDPSGGPSGGGGGGGGGVTTILVTADKIESPAGQLPRSLTAVSAGTLDDTAATALRDVVSFAPNASLLEFSARRLSFPFFRGIGSGQGAPGVTTTIDGVPQLTVGTTNLDLLGVERVEFLRGPDSTLYGRNALGGNLNIVTEQPAHHWTARARATVGTFAQQDYRLYLSGPLADDTLAFSLAATHSQRDGYTRNTLTGNDLDHRQSFFGRGKLRWTPDDRWDIALTLHGEDSRDGGFALSDLAGLRRTPHRLAYDYEGRSDRRLVGPALTATRYGPRVDVTLLASYLRSDAHESTDFDFTPADLLIRETRESVRQQVYELRLSSNRDAPVVLGDRARLRWLGGVILFHSQTGQVAGTEFRPAAVPLIAPAAGVSGSLADLTDLGAGVYAQATLTLFDRLDLTLGLRGDHESKQADLSGTFTAGGIVTPTGGQSLERDFNQFVPRFALAWRINPHLMPYASIAKGYKAGGFNTAAPAGRTAYGTETLWTYETGLKTTWLDDRLALSAAAFYSDWSDLQLSLLDPATGGFYLDNAGTAFVRGFEAEGVARLTDRLELLAGLGYTDARFLVGADPLTGNARGNRVPFAPEYTFHLGSQYTLPLRDNLRLVLRSDLHGTGEYFYNPGNSASQDTVVLLDFRIGLRAATERSSLRLDLFVHNAFDAEYFPIAFQYTLAPSGFAAESGAPRTVGLSASITY